MLKKLTIRNFKSLLDVSVEFPRLAVLFGPNAAGKSNLLDAVAALSWIGNVRTLSDVLDRPLPVRGHAFEAFSFPSGGLPALLQQEHARFSLEADLSVGAERYRYRIEPSIELRSGRLGVADEYLALLGRTGKPRGTPAIERVDSKLRVRRKGKPAHPREEPVGMNHSILSDRSLAGDEYRWLETVRGELGEWCAHYLDLISRHVRRVLPVFDRFQIEDSFGKVSLRWKAAGTDKSFGAHLTSDGSLRFFALVTLLNLPPEMLPSVLLLDEPELGLHPAAIALVGGMIKALAVDRQIIVATQSPLLVDAFDLEDVAVLELEDGRTTLHRPDADGYRRWLDEGFMPGEMWQKNLIGGRP